MSKRGSARLLLLSFRPRLWAGWGIGAAIAIAALAILVQAGGSFPLLAKTGLAQLLRQSAWEHALAGEPAPSPWPWDDTSPAANPKVPQLGLSASMVTAASEEPRQSPPLPQAQADLGLDTLDAEQAFGDVAIGDRITVTTADGVSHVYKVTGRGPAESDQAETDSAPADGEAPLVTCWPSDPLLAGSLRLIIQAIHAHPARVPAPSVEQKL